MKTKILSLIALASVAFTSCEALDELLNFSLEQTFSILVPAATTEDEDIIIVETIETNAAQKFEEYKTTADLIKEIKLDQLTLTITDADKTFDFLKSVNVYIASSETSDDKILLVSKSDINSTDTTLDLTTSKEGLAKYVKGDQFTLFFEGKAAKEMIDAINVDVKIKFKVTANPL
ncbi:MAG: hypothetical protein ACI7YS_00570 [Flavobacterium sp.]